MNDIASSQPSYAQGGPKGKPCARRSRFGPPSRMRHHDISADIVLCEYADNAPNTTYVRGVGPVVMDCQLPRDVVAWWLRQRQSRHLIVVIAGSAARGGVEYESSHQRRPGVCPAANAVACPASHSRFTGSTRPTEMTVIYPAASRDDCAPHRDRSA